ncbi:Lysophospholipid_acyltransferase [Hexamita inflata]|uniref:Lysophospholipid acyltransferase n=1 Tax=Hexamita inflata TaxID=28002 RepID=A0AA86R3S7_9EUKA|nr:Lysophospholipid acyltransferase [Hexamita inflata]
MQYKQHKDHHPFAAVMPTKNLAYYIYWTISIVLAPLTFLTRFTIVIIGIILNSVSLSSLIKGQNMDLPLKPLRRRIIRFFQILSSKIIIFGFGFTITERNKHLKPKQTENVLISNHVASSDPVVYASLGFTSFVSKEQVRQIPIYSTMAIAGQGLFVDRSARDGSSLRKMIDRISDNSGNFPLLTVFPEGTTVNQASLIQFKRGAFSAMKPVSMACIRYCQRFFNTSDASQNKVILQLKTMIAIWNPVVIDYMGILAPLQGETDVEFANRARNQYIERYGFVACDCTWKDNYYFNSLANTQYEDTSDYYKAHFGPEVTRQNKFVIFKKNLKLKNE